MGWFWSNKGRIISEWEMDKTALSRILGALIPIAEAAENPALCYMLLKCDEQLTKWLVSDGRRILMMTHQARSITGQKKFALAISLDDIKRIHGLKLSETSPSVRIQVKDKQIAIFEEQTLFLTIHHHPSQVVPDFEAVIPGPLTDKILFNKDAFIRVLNELHEKLKNQIMVKIELIAPKMAISIAGDLALAKTVDIRYSGKSMVIYFNINFLLNYLKGVIREHNITLELASPTQPGVVRSEDHVFVLLPMAAPQTP